MNNVKVKTRYDKLLKEIPRMDCDIRRLEDQGKDTSKLEKILEDKKGKLMEMSRKIYSAGKERGLIFVVSAPSGAGKTTICREVLKILPDLRFSVSCTTRPPRKGEKNGKDYYFISKEEFSGRIAKGEFVEWAENYGHLYGTLKKDMEDLLGQGYDIILDIDTRGARQVKLIYPDSIFVFILPPSIDILKQRLRLRGSEEDDVINVRIGRSIEEIKENEMYDYVIFNDKITISVNILRSVYIAEKNKREQLKEKIDNFINRR